MPRHYLTVALLIVIIAGALWFIDSPPQPFQAQPEPDPDALTLVRYFNNMESTQYDASGLPEHRFDAQRIEHRQVLSNQEENTTTAIISEPHFIFYEQGEARWQVQAEQGQTALTDSIEEELLLQNNVRLQQLSENNPARVDTDALWINPNGKNAYTDAYVELTSTGTISTGRGLEADIEQERITILSETRTRYEKPNQ